MVRGLYIGASGMMAQMHKMDALSNNMANVDVNGYKRDQASFKAFPELLIRRMRDNGLYRLPIGSADTMPLVGKLGTGVELNELYTVFEQGPLKNTGNPFDLALEGEGFLSVETPLGERYTRNGAFLLGKEGLLLTRDGYPVLGEKGRISIKKNNFVIDKFGRIFQNTLYEGDPERLVSMAENDWENMEYLDTLKIVNFHNIRYLKKEGNSLWKDTEHSGKAKIIENEKKPGVITGFLESSNVNPVSEMVQLIEVNRAYEANQKTIQTQDALTGKLINDAIKL